MPCHCYWACHVTVTEHVTARHCSDCIWDGDSLINPDTAIQIESTHLKMWLVMRFVVVSVVNNSESTAIQRQVSDTGSHCKTKQTDPVGHVGSRCPTRNRRRSGCMSRISLPEKDKAEFQLDKKSHCLTKLRYLDPVTQQISLPKIRHLDPVRQISLPWLKAYRSD